MASHSFVDTKLAVELNLNLHGETAISLAHAEATAQVTDPLQLQVGDKYITTALFCMPLQPGIKGIIGMNLLKSIGVTVSNLPVDFPRKLTMKNNVVSTQKPPELPKMDPAIIRALEAIKPLLDANASLPLNSHCTHPSAVISLNTGDATPVYRRQYPIPHKALSAVKKIIDSWIIHGYLEPGTPWNFPVTVTPKKDANGNKTVWRLCLDTRALNRLLPDFKYPLPLIKEIFPRLAGKKWYSKVAAMREAFLQFLVALADRQKLCFTLIGRRWMLTRPLFGLKPMSSHFQLVMDSMTTETNKKRNQQ